MTPRRKPAAAAPAPAAAKPRARKPRAPAKPKAPAKAAPVVDLQEMGARVLSVFGPFEARTLVEMPTSLAVSIFGDDLSAASRADVVAAVERDLEDLKRHAPELAASALAASAVTLAYELQNPYNSATSKSMCARALADAMTTLREWAPPAEKKDDVDDLKAARAARRARLPAAADLPGPAG